MIYKNADEKYIELLLNHSDDCFKPILEFLEKYADKSNKILDVGTGAGALVKILKDKGYENSCGIDLDERFIEAGKTHYGLEGSLYTLKEFSGQEKSFDIVISFTVAEHVEDVQKFIDFKLSFLKPGGIFYLYTPNYHNPGLYLRFVLSKLAGKKLHLTPFSKGSIFYSIFMFLKVSYYSVVKLLTKRVIILKVQAISPNISTGGDADACWCSNYLDTKNYFLSKKDISFKEIEQNKNIFTNIKKGFFAAYVKINND